MSETKSTRRLDLKAGAAMLCCAGALAGAAFGAAPGATAAPKPRSCGAKVITVPIKGGKVTKVAASRITVLGGATCRDAYAVIRGVVTKNMPQGWTVRHGNFTVPQGLTPQVAVNGQKRVMFALPGPG